MTLRNFTFDTKVHQSLSSGVFRGTYLGQPAILKRLEQRLCHGISLAKFRFEAEIAQEFKSPRIARVLATFEDDGIQINAYEDIGAASVAALIRQGALTMENILFIASEAALALGEVHAKDIIHKDLTANNIVANLSTGRVQIIDFGIATKLSREMQVIESLGRLEGTVAYLSPEQTGRMNRSIDLRTDFYSLGATLYEMLTGTPPFSGKDVAETVHMIMATIPASPALRRPDMPPMLVDVVNKLLDKSAEKRYASAAGLHYDLALCLEQWRGVAPASAESYRVLGTHDHSSRFKMPDRLYGREAEVSVLTQAFERAARGANELVYIAGTSGIGKTALVNELQRPIVARRGQFADGKADQFRRVIPLSTIGQAFDRLLDAVLAETLEAQAQVRSQVLEAVGDFGQAVAQVVPCLELLLGPQPAPPDLDPGLAKSRLLIVMDQLVRIFARPGHPLVIFLDDLQWVDPLSLEVLSAWASPSGPEHLLVIVAYRDNETSPSHPAIVALEKIQAAGGNVTGVHLAPLDALAVDQLVADMAGCGVADAHGLGALTMAKTGGNAFFLRTFLQRLNEDGLITYDHDKQRWTWDLRRLEGESITANVVQILLEKMQDLGGRTIRALELAACFGSKFDLATLALLRDSPPSQVARDLWPAVQEGLVVPLHSDYRLLVGNAAIADEALTEGIGFTFAHDRVQEAAHELLPVHQRRETHFRIGQNLLQSLPPDEQRARVFDLVGFLNHGHEFIASAAERCQIARLNVIAGEFAQRASAYVSAADYFNQAMSLLSDDAWTATYDLASACHLGLARAHRALAQYKLGLDLLEVAIKKLRTPLEIAKAYETLGGIYESHTEHEKCIEACITGLGILGFRIQARVFTPRLAFSIIWFKFFWMRRTLRYLEAGGPPADERWRAIVDLVVRLTASAIMCNQNLFVFAVLRLFSAAQRARVFLLHPTVTMILGMVAVSLRDRDAALKIRDLAYKQVQKFTEHQSVPVWHIPDGHWISALDRSYEELVEINERGFQEAKEYGDPGFQGANSFLAVLNTVGGGFRLDEAKLIADRYRNFFLAVHPENHFRTMYWSVSQLIRNLMGLTADSRSMSDPSIGEDFIRQGAATSAGDKSMYSTMRSWILFNDGDYKASGHIGLRNPVQLSLPGCFSAAFSTAITGLSLIRARRSAAPVIRSSLLTHALVRLCILELRWWGAPTVTTGGFRELVQAEYADMCGKPWRALQKFEQAMALFDQAKAYYWLAQTHEALGRCYLRAGLPLPAASHFATAVAKYRVFGAHPKAARLVTEHHSLIARTATSDVLGPLTSAYSTLSGNSSGGFLGHSLDMEHLVKASQSISSGMTLDQLMVKLLHITMENGSATTGALLTRHGDGMHVSVMGSMDGRAFNADVIHLPLESAEADSVLSRPIVRYVLRTNKALILNDLAASAFALDPYVLATAPRSLICMPVVIMGSTQAVLFLANNLVEECFSPRRVDSLQILASQGVMSLQNAGYLRDIGDLSAKVEERENSLTASTKLSVLGELASEMAHEIASPLAVIFGSAQLLTIATRAERPDMASIQQSASVIERTAMRMAKIVRGIRVASRDGEVDPFEPTNLGQIVEEMLELCVSKARDRSVKIHSVPFAEEVIIECRAVELGRVLLNLLNNALDATSDLPTKWVRLEVVPDTQNVVIRVIDSGDGIAPDIRDKLMTPYFTTKKAGHGTGLGLSLSKSIVEAHNGSFAIDASHPNTCFELVLPRRQPLPAH